MKNKKTIKEIFDDVLGGSFFFIMLLGAIVLAEILCVIAGCGR